MTTQALDKSTTSETNGPATPAGEAWPVAIVTLPAAATEEETYILTQAAVDAGALGGQTGAGMLQLFVAREDVNAMRTAIERAVKLEAKDLGWEEPAIKWDMLADAPWATAWKADFKALPVGERLLIRPDWEKGMPIPADMQTREVIYIRPGGGFGTARHESTRLALELLEQYVQSGTQVLDFGSGSGILAIAAARLGAEKVIALDYDPQAILNGQENIELNGMVGRIEMSERAEPDPAKGGFHLIICNMLPHEVRPHWKTLAELLAMQGPKVGEAAPIGAAQPAHTASLIYSGMLGTQKEEIEKELAQLGLHARAWAESGEWMAGVFAGK